MICEHLRDLPYPVLGEDRNREQINHKALACLSRTSRNLFYSAVPILWGGREIHTSEILVMLPGVLKGPSNSFDADCTITMVLFASHHPQYHPYPCY